MVQPNYSKLFRRPRRPFERDRLEHELQIVGYYGLKNKREIWRVGFYLAKVRRAARDLLILEKSDPRRQFEGHALLRRLTRNGILSKDKSSLEHVLSLKIENFLDRRLQTVVHRNGLAKSIHHARVLIEQGHIHIANHRVDIPSFIVRVDTEKHVAFGLNSPFANMTKFGRTHRIALRKSATAGNTAQSDDEAGEV